MKYGGTKNLARFLIIEKKNKKKYFVFKKIDLYICTTKEN